jgi:hypothetical protein
MIACQNAKATKKNRLPIAYLSIAVKYPTEGIPGI